MTSFERSTKNSKDYFSITLDSDFGQKYLQEKIIQELKTHNIFSEVYSYLENDFLVSAKTLLGRKIQYLVTQEVISEYRIMKINY
jgi:hypothetical protein